MSTEGYTVTSKSITILREHYLELVAAEKAANQEYDAAFEGSDRMVESAKRDAWLMARAKRQGFIEIIAALELYDDMFSVEDHHGK